MTIREQIDLAKQQEFLTVEQVALIAQYDPQTVYRKAKRGEIPGLKRFGRSLRFKSSVVLAWTARSRAIRDLQPA